MSPSRDIYVLCPRNSCSTPMMFRFLRETHIRNTKYNIQIRTTWAEVGGIYGDFQRKSCSNTRFRIVREQFFFTCLSHAHLPLWWWKQQEIDNCSAFECLQKSHLYGPHCLKRGFFRSSENLPRGDFVLAYPSCHTQQTEGCDSKVTHLLIPVSKGVLGDTVLPHNPGYYEGRPPAVCGYFNRVVCNGNGWGQYGAGSPAYIRIEPHISFCFISNTPAYSIHKRQFFSIG